MSMGMTAAAPPASRKEVPPWKLVTLMTMAGAIAGLLIVTAYRVTLPTIEHHKAEVMQTAVREVLKGPARFDTLYLHGGTLVKSLPAGVSAKDLEKVYLGRDDRGAPAGFAMSAVENGFQEPITLMFGYDPESRNVIAMKVVANKETPGLGDKIEKDSTFVNAFEGALVPLNGVKKERGKKTANDIEMITGATISSRAVMRMINNAVARWEPFMNAYREGGQP